MWCTLHYQGGVAMGVVPEVLLFENVSQYPLVLLFSAWICLVQLLFCPHHSTCHLESATQSVVFMLMSAERVAAQLSHRRENPACMLYG